MVKVAAILIAFVIMAFLLRVFIRSPKLGVLWIVATAPLEKLSLYAGLTWKPFILLTPPLVAALLWRWWKGKDPRPRLGKIEIVLASILLISFLSMSMAEDPGRTLRMGIQFGLLFGIVWCMIQTLRTSKDIQDTLQMLKKSGFVILLYGLFQFIGWPLGIDTHWLMKMMPENPTIPYMFTIPGAVVVPQVGPIVRLSSTFFDWNIFAAYVLLLLSISLSELLWRAGKNLSLRKELYSIGLTLFILFFTFSRSSWIGMCVLFIILGIGWRSALRKRKNIRRALIVMILVFVVGLSTSIGPFGYVRKRMVMMFEGDASIYKHTIYAQAALEMFRRSPALGIGLHNFSTYYTNHFDPNDFGTTSHSAYLSFFAETGLIGGTANLVLIFMILSTIWRVAQKHSPEDTTYAWILGLGAAYIGLLVSSFFYLFYNQVFLWVLVGLIVSIGRLNQTDITVSFSE